MRWPARIMKHITCIKKFIMDIFMFIYGHICLYTYTRCTYGPVLCGLCISMATASPTEGIQTHTKVKKPNL